MKSKRNKTAITKLVDWSMFKGMANGKTLQDGLKKMHEEGKVERPVMAGVECLQLLECRSQDVFLGVLAIYEEGKSVETLKTDKASKRKILGKEKLADGDKVDSALYFAVKGDSLVIIQSQRLHVKRLEGHLSELLSSSIEGAEGRLVLADMLSPETRALIIKEGVSEIHFSRWLEEESKENTIRISQGLFQNKISDSWDDNLAKGLAENAFSGIKTSVCIQLTKRKKSLANELLVRALALGLADELEGVALTLGNGKILKGDSLISRSRFEVKHEDGIPVLTDVYRGLTSILQ